MFKRKKKGQKTKPHPSTSTVALVGNPNVGKSAIFNLLTGNYVVVSNYPGTTVEVSRGICRRIDGVVEIVDTPGVNSLIPQSEDERVARDMLLEGEKKVIQVADAKNLRRALLITTQLAEMGLPMVLDLNMWDESMERGIHVDTEGLERILGIPVVKTVATEKRGMGGLLQAVSLARRPTLKVDYGQEIEEGIGRIEAIIPDGAGKRALALMLLAGDPSLEKRIKGELPKNSLQEIHKIRDALQSRFGDPLSYIIGRRRGAFVDKLVMQVVHLVPKKAESNRILRASFFFALVPLLSFALGYKIMDLILFMVLRQFPLPGPLDLILRLISGTASCVLLSLHLYRKDLRTKRTVSEVLGDVAMHPVAAYPILIVALWLIYKLVGVFGAGVCVDFLEDKFFGQAGQPSGGFDLWVAVPFTSIEYTLTHVNFQGLNYYLGLLANKIVSTQNLAYELFLDSKAGLIQVGLTYALAIVFPIVGFFFLAFGLMEDSGYLPRLAVMLDRLFKKIGLAGKAVLPMVLGLGCGTMAVLTTRILDTKKERLISTLLLALAIPCSAQLGVISFVLGRISGLYFALYIFVIGCQLLLVGFVASKILPGARSDFLLEVPPFRLPKFSNILIKTAYRVKWFLKEAVPLFLLGTLGLFVATKLGVLKYMEMAGRPVVGLLDLPPETTEGFLLGFLRRDYGAVSIFKALESTRGGLGPDPIQLLVSLVVITLFVPCLASFFVIIKERGPIKAMLIMTFIIPYAFLVGGMLNLILRAF
ncbi:MAG TPA: FeoB small GTPase domain-containing protein [Candidatus Hypogeohydataceae bacterium YC38]